MLAQLESVFRIPQDAVNGAVNVHPEGQYEDADDCDEEDLEPGIDAMNMDDENKGNSDDSKPDDVS